MTPTGSRRPAGPQGHWLAGNLKHYEDDRLGFLRAIRQDFGDVAAFNRRTTVVADMDLVEQILRDPDRSFEVPQNFLGQRLTAAEIDEITLARPLLNPGLRPRAVLPLQGRVRTLTMESFGASGEARSLDPMVRAEVVVSQVVARHFFGDDGPPLVPMVADLLDGLEQVIGNPFAVPARFRTPRQRQIERRHRRLRDAVTPLIVKRKEQDFGDMSSLVVRRGVAHTVDLLADLLIGSMLAAQRVPAASAGWLLMLVADHREVQAELQMEAAQFEQAQMDGAPLPAHRFPLALATVLESLRLYPPTWLIARVSSRPVQLGTFHFPAGHNFLISPYVLHRDPVAFPAPDAFDPGRWRTGAPPPRHFVSYGRGRHRCPGGDLATNCLVAMLLTLAHRYEVDRVGTVKPDPRVTLRPRGLRVILRPRSTTHRGSGTPVAVRAG